jgi:hypothetical protein
MDFSEGPAVLLRHSVMQTVPVLLFFLSAFMAFYFRLLPLYRSSRAAEDAARKLGGERGFRRVLSLFFWM